MLNFCLKSFAVFALVLCNSAYADTVGGFITDYRLALEEGEVSHIVDIDNDTLLMNRDDGFYTSGMRYTHKYGLRRSDGQENFGWRIGQELYTASDIKVLPQFVGPPDHPYAGWLYGGVFKESYREDGTYLRYGIDIGCIGPCAGGEWVQTQFHRLINQPLPQAWDKQVKNEFGAVLYAEFAPVRWTLGRSADVSPYFKARFGNIFTDADAGLLLRAGQLDVLPGQSTLHGFLRMDARMVGHNAALQGGYFSKNNPHTVKPKSVVGEAEIGVAWTQGAYGARISLVRRGNEIRGLPNSTGAQNFVRLQFGYTP